MANVLPWLTGREDRTADPWPFQPQAELRAYNPTPSERVGNWIQDLLMAGGAQPYLAGHVAHGVRDLLSMSPLGIGMSAADLLHAKSAGDPMGVAAAAIGMVPGAKPGIAVAKQGIRAYHGSPHDFERFDLSKIGTGEGAQAYGHGLYFAENEGVARGYRDALTRDQDRVLENGGRLPQWVASSMQSKNPVAIDDMRKTFQGRIAEAEEEAKTSIQPWLYPGKIAGLKDVLRAIEDHASGIPLKPAGRMYEVNINAKPEQFLDWDKPFQQQPTEVQQLLRAGGIHPEIPGPMGTKTMSDMPVGDLAKRNLQNPDSFLYKKIAAEGVPGIRYLDQGSRQSPYKIYSEGDKFYLADAPASRIAAHGPFSSFADAETKKNALDAANKTSNYVLFNDQLVDIMRKYGLAAPAAAGAASYAMAPQEAQAGKAQAAQFQQSAPLSDRINQIIDSLQWQDQWQGRMRLPLERKVNNMLGESVWPPMQHDGSYNTKLNSTEETAFQSWKKNFAPKDSGEDYDLRGAFKAGLIPATNGHWPDTYKKPNHSTFSDESQYYKDAPNSAGFWIGDIFVPPAIK